MSIIPEWKMSIGESIERRGWDGRPVDINSIVADTGLPYEVVEESLKRDYSSGGNTYHGIEQYCGSKKVTQRT